MRDRKPGRTPRQSRRIIPFTLHEVAEYTLGVGLVVLGVHLSGRMALVLDAAGGAWCLLGLVSHGKLGLFKRLSRRTHAIADLFLAALLAASPLLVLHRLDWLAVGCAEAFALIFARMSLWTIYDAESAAWRSGSPVRPAAPAVTSAQAAPGTSGSAVVASLARNAGRTAGRSQAVARNAAAAAAPKVSRGAHGLGKALGSARRASARRSAGRTGGDSPGG